MEKIPKTQFYLIVNIGNSKTNSIIYYFNLLLGTGEFFLTMAELTLNQVFGNNALFSNNPGTGEPQVTIALGDFQNVTNGGQILNGLGFNNVGQIDSTNVNDYAIAIFYALILLVSQNQAANINDDPEQTIFISDGGKTFGTGARDGQIRRRANVDIFSDLNINGFPDIDELTNIPFNAPPVQ
ncbi:MAG: hypothetical protein AAGA16_19035 [Cyanobacteria bacterium P01_E01_bin.35]